MTAPLGTLTIPLDHYLDGRYAIPIFGAAYYEACIVPVPGGGLPSPADSATPHAEPTGTLITYFTQGGGMDYRAAIEEVKTRWTEMSGQPPVHFEALPLYTSGAGGPSGGAHIATGSSSHPTTDAAGGTAGGTTDGTVGGSGTPQEALRTAIAVQNAEGEEDLALRRPSNRDAPPAYEPPPYAE